MEEVGNWTEVIYIEITCYKISTLENFQANRLVKLIFSYIF